MKRVFAGMMTVAALACVFAPAARAAEGELKVDAVSAYLWRGQALNDEPVVQPSLTVSTDYGLSFNTWGSYNLTDNLGPDADKEFTEVDVSASYAVPVKVVDLSVGVVDYEFPHTIVVTEDEEGRIAAAKAYPGTREASVTVGKSDFVLAPSATVSYDFDEANGFYGVFSLNPSYDLIADKLTAGLTVSVGAGSSEYNKFYFGEDSDALNDGTAKASLGYTLTKSCSVGAYVQYSKLLDSAIEKAAKDIYFNDGEMWLGGANVSYSF